MAIQLTSYSTFLKRYSALVGIPVSGMTDDELEFAQTFFDSQIHSVWDNSNWLAVCPYGEARFAGDLLTYPNDLSKTSYWTATALTVTANNLANPADGRVTASKALETTASSTHGVSQANVFIPSVTYQYAAYVRGTGRQYVQLLVNDGVNNYSSFFNIGTGVIGTASANLTQAATIQQQNNGFWLCTITFTSATTAGAGYASTLVSTDGSTTSYTGDATKGIYSWGQVLMQTSYADPSAICIPFDQVGEAVIDAPYQVWMDSPINVQLPRQQGYTLNPNSIQIIGSPGFSTYGVTYGAYPNGYGATANPFFIYYRKKCPDYTGDDYDATANYAVDDQILFENSSSVSNFYKCLVATTAGQSPTTTPASWELIEIPECFLQFVVYAAYADYLRMDGQMEKSVAMDAKAQSYADEVSDTMEREMGWVLPMKVQSHSVNQARNW